MLFFFLHFGGHEQQQATSNKQQQQPRNLAGQQQQRLGWTWQHVCMDACLAPDWDRWEEEKRGYLCHMEWNGTNGLRGRN
jgi:hypothetical protein